MLTLDVAVGRLRGLEQKRAEERRSAVLTLPSHRVGITRSKVTS